MSVSQTRSRSLEAARWLVAKEQLRGATLSWTRGHLTRPT